MDLKIPLNHGRLTTEEERVLVDAAQDEIRRWEACTKKLTGRRFKDESQRIEAFAAARKDWLRTGTKDKTRGSLDRLISMNYRLIIKITHGYEERFRKFGYERSDVFMIALDGFIEGVAKFDGTRARRLSSSVMQWMRAHLSREYYGAAAYIHVGASAHVDAFSVSIARDRFHQIHGQLPDDDELTEYIMMDFKERQRRAALATESRRQRGVMRASDCKEQPVLTEERVRQRIRNFHAVPNPRLKSLDAPAYSDEDGTIFMELIPDPSFDKLNGPEYIERKRTINTLFDAIADLPAMEREVIRLRFFHSSDLDKAPTHEAIAIMLHKHQMKRSAPLGRKRIMQLQTQALARLRETLTGQ